MSSFSLSVRRSSLCFIVSNGEKQTSCHHSHCLYVVRLYVLLSLMGEKQTSCYHSHCLYVVRLYVLLSLMGKETSVMSSFSLSVRRSFVCFTVSNGERNKLHVIILIVCTSFVRMFYCL